MPIRRTNPGGLSHPPDGVHSQVVSAAPGRIVYVSGTVPKNEAGELVGVDDMAAQVRQVMENLETSLAAEGATFSDVVRKRIYTTDTERYIEEGSPVRAEFMGGEEVPTSVLLEVAGLSDNFTDVADGEPTDVDPAYLVEIEVTAVLEE